MRKKIFAVLVSCISVYTVLAQTSPFDFTLTLNKSCITAATSSEILSVSWQTPMPSNSWISVGENSSFSTGYYNKNISGLTNTKVPNNFVESKTLKPFVILPGKDFYVSIYNGQTKLGTTAKKFNVPFCPNVTSISFKEPVIAVGDSNNFTFSSVGATYCIAESTGPNGKVLWVGDIKKISMNASSTGILKVPGTYTQSIKCMGPGGTSETKTASFVVFEPVFSTPACIATSTQKEVISITWGTPMPLNSWINIGDDPSFKNGFSNKSITGLSGTTIPDGFKSSSGQFLTVVPGKEYYVSIYNGQSGTASKKFSVPLCYLKKQTLIFSIDQNFGNGIVQKQDTVGLSRMIRTLEAFKTKYEVYALLASNQADKTKLTLILDALAKKNIPFVLDVYASDIFSVGSDSISSPYDLTHGRSLSVAQLQEYKTKYGSAFAGIRAHEVFGSNAHFIGCQKINSVWCNAYGPTQTYPVLPDTFYKKQYVTEYANFAKENRMFLLFSDHYWSAYQKSVNALPLSTYANQVTNEAELRDIVRSYPDTVVVVFANNEGEGANRDRIDTWQSETGLTYYANSLSGAKGFGLSDQSWICPDENNCPIYEVVSWATKAFAKNAIVVQTEPYWYWWNFPKGIIGAQSGDYTREAGWTNRGYATERLQKLAKSLGVTLPTDLLIAPILGAYQFYLNGSLKSSGSTANISKEGALESCMNQHANSVTTPLRCTWNGVEIYSVSFDFSITPLQVCARSSTEPISLLVNWGSYMPAGSFINVGEEINFSTGFFNKNISGLSTTTIPTGTFSATKQSLIIQPGKDYYISIYNGATQQGSKSKRFNVPLCTVSESDFKRNVLVELEKDATAVQAFVKAGVEKALSLTGVSVARASESKECINITKNLHRGFETDSVLKLQNFLAEKGFLLKPSTGFFGDKTVEAVKEYQSSKGLPETGMVYGFTRNAIKEETCN